MVICTHYLARVYSKLTLGHFLQTFTSLRKCHFWRPYIWLTIIFGRYSICSGLLWVVRMDLTSSLTHPKAWIFLNFKKKGFSLGGGGGTELDRKAVLGCAVLKIPFSHLSFSSQGSHFKQKRQFTRPSPFWENLEILASTASIFAQILALKPPNFEIFSSQAPQIWKFQFTRPHFQKQKSVRKPHT